MPIRFLFRAIPAFLSVSLLLASCNDQRVFEDNKEFPQRLWAVTDQPTFQFSIDDTVQVYNVYYNVRNSLQYEWDRIFVTYVMSDTAGAEISRKLVYNALFDPTGRPLGQSGLGDLFDHQFPLLNGYRFPHRGLYTLRLIQFSRQDTLRGVLAAGVRVERAGEQ